MTEMMIDNVNIHYEYYPCNHTYAQTLILIHGYLSSTFSFRKLIPLLTETYSVAAIDLPGFGKSEKSRAYTYSMTNYGKLVLAFMEKMKIAKASLVGHSMGGQIALQAARQQPERVKKLILLASSGYLKPFNRWLVRLSYVPFFPWLVRKAFERREAREVLLDVVADPAMIDEAMIRGYKQPMLDKNFYQSLVGLLRSHGGDLAKEQLAEIKTPALLLWGREDKIVPLEIGKRLEQDLPDASLAVYDQTGHLLPEEKPLDVYHAIQSFLSC